MKSVFAGLAVGLGLAAGSVALAAQPWDGTYVYEQAFGPGAGGTQTLPRAIGTRRAKEILLTGLPFTAEQALAWGLVNRICPAESLMQDVLATAARIANNAPISTRQIKHSVNFGGQMDLASALMFEIEVYNRMVPTEDRREGINAFNEKRKPVFKGR